MKSHRLVHNPITQYFLPAGLLMILLAGCEATGTLSPTSGASLQTDFAASLPSSTACAEESTSPEPVSPSSTPEPSLIFQSPLEGISIEQLSGMITNPYNPPAAGSDDPHAGIDLSERLPGSEIAVGGRSVLAVTGGQIAAVIQDRFPFGNAVIIETRLSDLPLVFVEAMGLPEKNPAILQPISLTCPNGIPKYEDTGERSLYILYAHLEQPSSLSLGDEVTIGQQLGLVGMSGNALNPHLHMEVRVGPSNVQPGSMSHYDESATVDEMTAYCAWSVGGQFQVIDPMKIYTTYSIVQ